MATASYEASSDSLRTRKLTEAFLVHMAMAWLKLMQAHSKKTGGDLFIRDKAGRRVRHEDGDWRYKASSQLLREHFADNDPRRVNIESFTGLRNRVEHRHETNIAALVAGRRHGCETRPQPSASGGARVDPGLRRHDRAKHRPRTRPSTFASTSSRTRDRRPKPTRQ